MAKYLCMIFDYDDENNDVISAGESIEECIINANKHDFQMWNIQSGNSCVVKEGDKITVVDTWLKQIKVKTYPCSLCVYNLINDGIECKREDLIFGDGIAFYSYEADII